jgi:hypothetical protein
MWALFVITLLDDGDAKYTRIGSFENRHHCEIVLEHFYDENEPFQDNEIVTCLRVDE